MLASLPRCIRAGREAHRRPCDPRLASGARAACGAPQEIRSLNAIRGLAALMVAIVPRAGRCSASAETLPHAYLAVDLFFVLSGFVMLHAYEARITGGLKLGASSSCAWRGSIHCSPSSRCSGFAVAMVKLAMTHQAPTAPMLAALPLSLVLVPARAPRRDHHAAYPVRHARAGRSSGRSRSARCCSSGRGGCGAGPGRSPRPARWRWRGWRSPTAASTAAGRRRPSGSARCARSSRSGPASRCASGRGAASRGSSSWPASRPPQRCWPTSAWCTRRSGGRSTRPPSSASR